MHAKVGGGSRRSSMGIGPWKSNPLLLLSALGRVQRPLKTQTIFIPKSPGSSSPCSRPWEPYNGEDSRKVLEWRMWWDLDTDPVHHLHHVDREIQAKINHLQLKGKVCTGEDYSSRPRQALYPLTQEHGAHWIQSQGWTPCCSPHDSVPSAFEKLIQASFWKHAQWGHRTLSTPSPRAPRPSPKEFL